MTVYPTKGVGPSNWVKFTNLFQEAGPIDKLNILAYITEIVVYRITKKRLRKYFRIHLYGLTFLVKTHNMDLEFIHEIFGRHVYDHLPAFVVQAGQVCLDIGANIGCVSLLWASHNRSGTILALEPHPETFARLKTNLALNQVKNVIPLQYAVAQVSGPISMELSDSTSMARTSDNPIGSMEHASSVILEGYALDDLVRKYKLQKIDLLKIDVEGFEVECLRGAVETLCITDRIILEYHSEALREQCLAILSVAGFRVREVREYAICGLFFAQKASS